MKRTIALLFVAIMSLSLAACTNNEAASSTSKVPAIESTESNSGQAAKQEPSDKKTASDKNTGDSSAEGIRPEFKEAMDSYEAFFDEYVAFMEKYAESDDTTSLLADYSNYMSQYAEVMKKMDAIDEDELSTAEAAYYLEVSTRITQKLATVA